MNKLIVLAACVAVMASSADAQRRPVRPPAKAAAKPAAVKPVFSFLGVTPEAPVTAATVGGKECAVSAIGKTQCSVPYTATDFKIGNAPIYILNMNFNDGKLYTVFGSVKSFAYLDLLSAFTAKYGPASTTKIEKWQSKAGATFDNAVSTWQFKGGELELKAMGSRRDDSDFFFFHAANAPASAPTPVNF
jgi:hypothetical protein